MRSWQLRHTNIMLWNVKILINQMSYVSYETCKAAVKLSPPTNQKPSLLPAGCPSCRPTNSAGALKEILLASNGENLSCPLGVGGTLMIMSDYLFWSMWDVHGTNAECVRSFLLPPRRSYPGWSSVSWLFLLGCQYQCKWLTGKTPLRNDYDYITLHYCV